jgi:hypothetical protein
MLLGELFLLERNELGIAIGIVVKREILVWDIIVLLFGIVCFVECGENFLNNKVDNVGNATDL